MSPLEELCPSLGPRLYHICHPTRRSLCELRPPVCGPLPCRRAQKPTPTLETRAVFRATSAFPCMAKATGGVAKRRLKLAARQCHSHYQRPWPGDARLRAGPRPGMARPPTGLQAESPAPSASELRACAPSQWQCRGRPVERGPTHRIHARRARPDRDPKAAAASTGTGHQH